MKTKSDIQKLAGRIQKLAIEGDSTIQELQAIDRRGLVSELDLKAIRGTFRELANLLTVAEVAGNRPPGRPPVHSDNATEKTRFKGYLKEGLSLREIAKLEGCGKDTVAGKLARYGLGK